MFKSLLFAAVAVLLLLPAGFVEAAQFNGQFKGTNSANRNLRHHHHHHHHHHHRGVR